MLRHKEPNLTIKDSTPTTKDFNKITQDFQQTTKDSSLTIKGFNLTKDISQTVKDMSQMENYTALFAGSGLRVFLKKLQEEWLILGAFAYSFLQASFVVSHFALINVGTLKWSVWYASKQKLEFLPNVAEWLIVNAIWFNFWKNLLIKYDITYILRVIRVETDSLKCWSNSVGEDNKNR